MPLYLAGGGVLLLLGCFVCTGGGALTMWLVLKSDRSDRDKTAATASKKTAKELIVGKWETSLSQETYEFTQDGRFIHTTRPGDRPDPVGTYVVLDETHMEIAWLGGPIPTTFSVSETELTLGSFARGTFRRAR
jgi:hypothetical protein